MRFTTFTALALGVILVGTFDSSNAEVEQSDSATGQRHGSGLTKQQYDQTIATMVASGMSREQAEAMLAMAGAAGAGTPGGLEQLQSIAAMDPNVQAETSRAGMESSEVTVRYDGVDYHMQYVLPQTCKAVGFIRYPEYFVARSTPDAERGPTLRHSGDSGWYGFSFWLDFDPDIGFDNASDQADNAAFRISMQSGNAGLIVEESRLSYTGSADNTSGKTVSIEATFCAG